MLVLMARTGDAQSGARGISAFAVPANAPGISYGKRTRWAGTASPHATISFDNVRIPVDHLLGSEGEGLQDRHEGPGRRTHQHCHLLGGRGARRAGASAGLHAGAQTVRQSLASFQALQFKLADMATELVAARQMVRLAASKLDAGAAMPSTYCAMAKRFATDAGFAVCNGRCSCTAATATSANTRSSACCATRACTRFWKARTNHARHHCPAHARERCTGRDPLGFDSCLRFTNMRFCSI